MPVRLFPAFVLVVTLPIAASVPLIAQNSAVLRVSAQVVNPSFVYALDETTRELDLSEAGSSLTTPEGFRRERTGTGTVITARMRDGRDSSSDRSDPATGSEALRPAVRTYPPDLLMTIFYAGT